MPRPKGLPKTGGRKKGTPNKATHARYLAKLIEERQIEEELLRITEILERRKAHEAAKLKEREEAETQLQDQMRKQAAVDAKRAEIEKVTYEAKKAIYSILVGKHLHQSLYSVAEGHSIPRGTVLTVDLLEMIDFDLLPFIPTHSEYMAGTLAIHKQAEAEIEVLIEELGLLRRI